jgi:hypothetical protein
MGKFAIVTALAVYATALAVVPMVTPAKATTINSKHIKKHKRTVERTFGSSDPRSTGQHWPVSRPSSQAGSVCPGIARSFECATWPPPMDDDPDRKHSSSDGG